MTRVVKRPAAAAQLAALLSRLTWAGAQGAAAVLAEKLSGEGTGIHHPWNPRRSSAPGEYPAEQSGELRDSISAKRLGGTRAAFGSIDGPEYNTELHFRPPDWGGRPFMDFAKHDPDIHAVILDVIRTEVKP